MLPNQLVLLYKAWDQIPYDNISPSKEIQTSRLETLFQLTSDNKNKIIVLTTLNAVVQKTLPKNEIKKNFISISKNSTIGNLVCFVAIFTAFLTSIYSWRLFLSPLIQQEYLHP